MTDLQQQVRAQAVPTASRLERKQLWASQLLLQQLRQPSGRALQLWAQPRQPVLRGPQLWRRRGRRPHWHPGRSPLGA